MQSKAAPMRLRSLGGQVKRSPQECARSPELRILKEKAGQLKAKDFMKLRADLETCKVGSQFPKRPSSELEAAMPAAICALQLLDTERLIANSARGASASHAASPENMEWTWKALATPGKLIARINQFHSDLDNGYVSPKHFEALRKYLATPPAGVIDYGLQISTHLHQWLEAVLNYVDFREQHAGLTSSQREEKKHKVVAEEVDAPGLNGSEAEKPAAVIADVIASLPAGAENPIEVVAEDAEFVEVEKAGPVQPAESGDLVGKDTVSPAAVNELQGDGSVAKADTEEALPWGAQTYCNNVTDDAKTIHAKETLPEAEKADSAEVQHVPEANEAEAEDQKPNHLVAQVAEALPVSTLERQGVAAVKQVEALETKWADDVEARDVEVIPAPSEGQEFGDAAAGDAEAAAAMQAAPDTGNFLVGDEKQDALSRLSEACAEGHNVPEVEESWTQPEETNNDAEAIQASPVESVRLIEVMAEDAESSLPEEAFSMEAEIRDSMDEATKSPAATETQSEAVEDAAVVERDAAEALSKIAEHGDNVVGHSEVSEANEANNTLSGIPKTSSANLEDDIAETNEAVDVEATSAEELLSLAGAKLSGGTLDTSMVEWATDVVPGTQQESDSSFLNDNTPAQASGSVSLTQDNKAPEIMTGTLSKTAVEDAEAAKSDEVELEEKNPNANATSSLAMSMLSPEDWMNDEAVGDTFEATEALSELDESGPVEQETAEATAATVGEESGEVVSEDFGNPQAEDMWPKVEKHTEVIMEATVAFSAFSEKPGEFAAEDAELDDAEKAVVTQVTETSDVPVEGTEITLAVELTDAEVVETCAESAPEVTASKCIDTAADYVEPDEAMETVMTNLKTGTAKVAESSVAGANEQEEKHDTPCNAATHVPRLLLASVVENAGDDVANHAEITEDVSISSNEEDPDNMIFDFAEEAVQTIEDGSHAQEHTLIEEIQNQTGCIADDAKDATNETTKAEMEDSERAQSDVQNLVLGATEEGCPQEHEEQVSIEDGMIETSLMDELIQFEDLDSVKLDTVKEHPESVNNNTYEHSDAWPADGSVGKIAVQDDIAVVFESPTPHYHESLGDKWNHAAAEAEAQLSPNLQTLDARNDGDESMLAFPGQFSHTSDDDPCINLCNQAEVGETTSAEVLMENVEVNDAHCTAVLDACSPSQNPVDEAYQQPGKLVTEADMLEHMQKQIAPNLSRRCTKPGEDPAVGVDPSKVLPEIAARDSPKVCQSNQNRNHARPPMWAQFACVAVLGVNVLWASLVSLGYLNLGKPTV